MKVSSEFKVGLTVILGIGLLVSGLFFLKGVNLFTDSKEFYVVYDKTYGLAPANPVMINGFKIGQVKNMELHPDNSGRILVTLYVEPKGFKITRDAVAKLESENILGNKKIELYNSSLGEEAQSGDTLNDDLEKSLQESMNELIRPLEEKTKVLIGRLDTLVFTVTTIFNEETIDNLGQSVTKINSTLSVFKNVALNMDTMMDNTKVKLESIVNSVDQLTTTLKNNSGKINNILVNFSDISNSLAQADVGKTFLELQNTVNKVNGILTKINNGEGSMGMLINDTKLHDELEETNQAMQDLLEDIRLNPNRYLHFSVIGRKDKGIKLTPKEDRKLRNMLEEGTEVPVLDDQEKTRFYELLEDEGTKCCFTDEEIERLKALLEKN